MDTFYVIAGRIPTYFYLWKRREKYLLRKEENETKKAQLRTGNSVEKHLRKDDKRRIFVPEIDSHFFKYETRCEQITVLKLYYKIDEKNRFLSFFRTALNETSLHLQGCKREKIQKY